ncbi:MAG: rod shape-determining protein RodA [Burkholderiales bacterium]
MRSLLRGLGQRVGGSLDGPLLVLTTLIVALGLVTLYSATKESPARFNAQLVNIAVGVSAMLIIAQVPQRLLQRLALPTYLVGLMLLIGVAVAGDIVNGARRWLNLGFTRIQPSEIMKLAIPLALAWYFQRIEGAARLREFIVAALLLIVPVALIVRQPDLGTAMLVAAAGFYAIFLAGLSWRIMLTIAGIGAACIPFVWTIMHDYQRRRISMLLDPTQDPLGAGYHTIQSTIAVGSGGLIGKGWLNGTQTHLEFIPERHTDFIFAVLSEEFGLIGNVVLIMLYIGLITRGMVIASTAPTIFARSLAGTLVLCFFTYAFVNIGMVIGILPVVGVPLPLVSYGGTALVTLFVGIGILMGIARRRPLNAA